RNGRMGAQTRRTQRAGEDAVRLPPHQGGGASDQIVRRNEARTRKAHAAGCRAKGARGATEAERRSVRRRILRYCARAGSGACFSRKVDPVKTRKLELACPTCGSGEVFYSCTPNCCFNHVCADCGTTFEPMTTAAGGTVSGVVPPDPLPEAADPTA